MARSIKKWSDEADAKLQDCFASTDWNMFRDSFDGIGEYFTSVIGFINKCINDLVPTVTGCPQVVRVGNNTSATLILNTGAPQGCMLSPHPVLPVHA